MHLPTLGAESPAVLSRFLPAGRSRVPAALVVLLFGSAAALAGCRDEMQADSPAPTLAPSAPLGAQSKPTGKCLSAAELAQFVTVDEAFPLCVVGLHLGPARDGGEEQPSAFGDGEPAWDSTPQRNGPVSGVACQKSLQASDRKQTPGQVCTTVQELWTVGSGRTGAATASPITLRLAEPAAGKGPPRWVTTQRFTIGIQTYSLFGHASYGDNRSGDVYLVNSADYNAFTSLDGLVDVALPAVPSLESTFYYTGASAFYVGDPPAKTSPGLYRASCEVDKSSSHTCSSELITAFPDEPGRVASDVEGNVVAAHESGTAGREILAFPAATLNGTAAGTPVVPRGPERTASLTVIGGSGQPKYLVSLNVSSLGAVQPLQLLPISFTGTSATVEAPLPGSVSIATGSGTAPSLSVFRDAAGDLWIAADSNGASPGGTPAFLHFAARSE